jgi:hypothetical protein
MPEKLQQALVNLRAEIASIPLSEIERQRLVSQYSAVLIELQALSAPPKNTHTAPAQKVDPFEIKSVPNE